MPPTSSFQPLENSFSAYKVVWRDGLYEELGLRAGTVYLGEWDHPWEDIQVDVWHREGAVSVFVFTGCFHRSRHRFDEIV